MVSCGFKNGDRSDPDVRFVVVHKRIGEEMDGFSVLSSVAMGRMEAKPHPQRGDLDRGDLTTAIDPEGLFKEPPPKGRRSEGVEQEGHRCRKSREKGHPAKGEISERSALEVVTALEVFVLEFGHIDVGGAFGLTGFAFETKLHGVVDFGGGEGFGGAVLHDGVAQDVCATASAVLFFAGGLIRRAHRPRSEGRFAADACAVAKLGGP